MLEFGVLGKVDAISDDGMRFYALVGLCVSTAAAIEHHLFDCFRSTSGKSQKRAAEEFYKNVFFDRKRKLANASVRAALINSSASLRIWDEIISEVQQVCGPDGARNLVSHNPLTKYIMIRRKRDGSPDMIDGSALYAELAVRQNLNVVLTGKRRPAKQTFSALKNYAYALCGGRARLAHFYQTYLAMRTSPSP